MDEANLLLEGIDFKDGLSRFGNNISLYLRFLKKFPEDPNFLGAKEAFKNYDYKELLFSVHALKGVAGNLSILPVYDVSSELVTLLRKEEKDTTRIKEQFQELCVVYERAVNAITDME